MQLALQCISNTCTNKKRHCEYLVIELFFIDIGNHLEN